MRLRFLSLALLPALAACAGLPSGGRETVRFASDPPGALATTSLGPSCTTPCALSIARLDEFSVTFTRDGFQPRTVQVQSIVPRLSGGIRTEIGGIGVSAGLVNQSSMNDPTGQFRREHTPNPVEVALSPVGGR